MDWSPIWISMKTATLSILITFFLGVWMARLVVSARSEKVKMVLDGILTLPMGLLLTVAGFFLLMIFGEIVTENHKLSRTKEKEKRKNADKTCSSRNRHTKCVSECQRTFLRCRGR